MVQPNIAEAKRKLLNAVEKEKELRRKIVRVAQETGEGEGEPTPPSGAT